MALITTGFWTTGLHQFIVPPGVYAIAVFCFGAGNDGGASGSTIGGMGGPGGGAGALGIKFVLATTPGEIIDCFVGSRANYSADIYGNIGTDSFIYRPAAPAVGLCRGAGPHGPGIQNGQIAGCIGDTARNGGTGGPTSNPHGAGGGSSPSLVYPYSDGGNGDSFGNPGAVGTFVGGLGGASGTPGQPGQSAANPPGLYASGGGGGGGTVNGIPGGLGGNGVILLQYEGVICNHVWLAAPTTGLLRVDFDGDPVYLVQPANGQFDLDLVYLPGAEFCYYTETGGRLMRQALSGAQPPDVLYTVSGCRGVVRDPVQDKLYFIEHNGGSTKKVWRIDSGGTAPTTLVSSGLNNPRFIGVSGNNGWIYVTDGESSPGAADGRMLRYQYTGAFDAVLDNVGRLPSGIYVDEPNSYLYWADATLGQIFRTNLSGLFKVTLHTVSDVGADPTGIWIDTFAERMWWTEPTLDRVRSMNVDGSDVRTEFTMLSGTGPVGIELCGSPVDGDGETTTTSTTSTSTTPDPLATTTTSTTPNPLFTTTTTTPDPLHTTTTTSTTTSTTREPDGTDARGREQIAVDQPQGGTNYPFISPSNDLGELLGDLYLAFRDQNFTPPFSIKRLKNFQQYAVLRYELLIVDALGATVFDTEASDPTLFKQYMWTDARRIIEYGDANKQVLRVVIYAAWADGEVHIVYGSLIQPTDGRLDSRVLEALPGYVEQIVVRQPDNSEVELPVGSNVIFAAGYNMVLTEGSLPNTDGGVFGASVTFDATPGAGLGRYPGCDENKYILTINQVKPDSQGNLRLEYAGSKIATPDNQGCYRIERPLATVAAAATSTAFQQITVTPATLKLYNNCSPCCTCDDFVRVYEAIRRLYNLYKQLGIRAEAVRDQYSLNKDRWMANRACREKTLLRTAMTAIGRCKMGVAGGLCNNQDTPLFGSRLKLDFTGSDAVGCVRCDSVFRKGNTDPVLPIPSSRFQPYTLEGSWPIYYAEHDCVSQGELGYVTWQFDFPAGADGDVIRLTLSVDGTNPTGALPVSETAVLRCSASTDPMCCVEPTTTTTTTAGP